MTLDKSPWVRLSLYLVFITWVGAIVLHVGSEVMGDPGVVAPPSESAYPSATSPLPTPSTLGLFGVVLAITAVFVLQTNLTTEAKRNGRVILILGGLAGHMARRRDIDFAS